MARRKQPLRKRPVLPVLGCPEVSWRRAGGVVMGAPQILSTLPCSDTGRGRILNLVCQGAGGLVDRTGMGHTGWWAGSY